MGYVKCRNCGELVRRINPGEGYDLREYQWTHEDGGLMCDMEPPMAEPEGEAPALPVPFADRYGPVYAVTVTYADGRSADLPVIIAAGGGWHLEAPEGACTVAGLRVSPGDVVRGTISLT